MNNTGWICPRCNAANAPSVQRCACDPQMGAAPYLPGQPVPTPYVPGPIYVPATWPREAAPYICDACRRGRRLQLRALGAAYRMRRLFGQIVMNPGGTIEHAIALGVLILFGVGFVVAFLAMRFG